MKRKNPIAVTIEQGGYWHEWKPWTLGQSHGLGNYHIHAMLFEDGTIWDCTVGWRKANYDYREVLRNHMVRLPNDQSGVARPTAG